MKRVALYMRAAVNAEVEGQFTPLERQERLLRDDLTARRDKHVIVDTFRDAGASGVTLERPGLQRMLEVCEEGELDLIMVTSVDRLSRSSDDLRGLTERIRMSGVEVEVIDG